MKLSFFSTATEYKKSYAQTGEDLLIGFAFEHLGITKCTYLDIGAHDAIHFSNTYLFYKRGSSGVCVEPNTILCEVFPLRRPRDKCLNIAVGARGVSSRQFFILNPDTLSTLSLEWAEWLVSIKAATIEKVITIPVRTINDILSDCEKVPELVSIDVEGDQNVEVVRSIDFTRFHPAVFCIETIKYHPAGRAEKLQEIPEIMHKHEYFTFADSYVNTIFVDRVCWNKRFGIS